MRITRLLALSALCAIPAFTLAGQGGRGGNPAGGAAAPTGDPNRRIASDTAPAVTHGQTQIAGQTVRYTATAAILPIKSDQNGDADGQVFYVAYTKDGVTDPSTRPVTFMFNGGPGSATVWLHLGAFGPKRVRLNPDGSNPPPPYSWEDNPYSLLDLSDLVFIDAIGTGYSRPATPASGPRFWGLDEDMRAFAEFIRLWLVKNERWGSPKFIGGESYGTTRAAHLSGYLTDQGIALNGVILLSSVLNFENSRPAKGNDIGFIGFFPSFALTAWYHKKVAPELQKMSVTEFARAAEKFTTDEYAPALLKGEAMTAAEKQAIVAKISRWTGMSAQSVIDSDLRLGLGKFSTDLLREQRQMTGRLDSRFKTFNPDPTGAGTSFDPSDASIRNSFTPVMNDYARRVLNYKNDNLYYILGGGIGAWRYPEGQYANVVPSLERAFNKNPDMKLYVAMGYYDMATPYWAVQYTLDHMTLDPKIRANNITTDHFEAGHMMYIEDQSMKKLRDDLRRFITGALPKM